jgi:hypothetical protein
MGDCVRQGPDAELDAVSVFDELGSAAGDLAINRSGGSGRSRDERPRRVDCYVDVGRRQPSAASNRHLIIDFGYDNARGAGNVVYVVSANPYAVTIVVICRSNLDQADGGGRLVRGQDLWERRISARHYL